MTLWEILIFLLCLAFAAILVVTRFKLKLPERTAKEAGHAPVVTPAHPDPHHPAKGGGGDDHHDKKNPIKTAITILFVIGAAVALGLFIFWLMELGKKEWQNNTTYSVGRAQTAQAFASMGSTSVRVTPPNAINCDQTPVTMIAPRQSINMFVDGKKYWFEPDTIDGTIEACVYGMSHVCSSTYSPLRASMDFLTITNKTDESVEFRCRYL